VDGNEWEAAGRRNFDNFAPPIPKFRATLPIRYEIAGHAIGVRGRYISGYSDESENTYEELGRFEDIDAWTVFDVDYGYTHDFGWMVAYGEIGALNVMDADPPTTEDALGYQVGIHDPRGRVLYLRLRGEF
jgi:iron complex outermembrane receptor protein